VGSTPRTPPAVPAAGASPPPTSAGVDNAGSGSPKVVELGLGLTLGLSLVLFALALAPLRVLPRSFQMAAYDGRREPLLYAAVVIYLATGLSLVIALLAS
jgi:hypothetical protein